MQSLCGFYLSFYLAMWIANIGVTSDVVIILLIMSEIFQSIIITPTYLSYLTAQQLCLVNKQLPVEGAQTISLGKVLPIVCKMYNHFY